MAIYHLRLKVLSRSLGRAPKPGGLTRNSVVNSAAYRSGQRLFDSTIGRWFKHDNEVVHSEILIPEGVEAPVWLSDRQALWNAVERSEKRVDAQLAREIELTLPRELTKPQQIDLVRRFVKEHFVSKGMVADINIHCPMAADGQKQPHAHVLLTMRRIDAGAEHGFSSLKERDWNEREDIAREVAEARKRFNNTGLDADHEALEVAEAKRNVNIWRKEWADVANHALAQAGSEARIDHRTLEKQGIFRAPQISLGIARHVEKAYDFIKDRITQWVAIKKRASLYSEVEHLKSRDVVAMAEFVLNLAEMAEDFVDKFRRPPHEIPEVPLER